MTATVRHADAARDAAACAAIYAPSVTHGIASFEEDPPGTAEFARRIARISARYPWLVTERDGAVVAYAYGAPHRDRSAYRWTAETSIYVDARHHRAGIARELYGVLLALLERQGVRWALAGITLPNPASVRLHEALGYERAGVFRAIGFKHGAWHDVGWWQRELAPPTDPPAEPLSPQSLDGGSRPA